jgi:hypothetical protein
MSAGLGTGLPLIGLGWLISDLDAAEIRNAVGSPAGKLVQVS